MTAAGFPSHLRLYLPAQHSRETVAIGSPGGWRNRRSPQARRDRLHHPCPDGNSPATSPWVATQGGTPSFTHATHLLIQPTMLKTLEVASISLVSQPQAPPRVGPARLSDELLQLQEKMNMVLE